VKEDKKKNGGGWPKGEKEIGMDNSIKRKNNSQTNKKIFSSKFHKNFPFQKEQPISALTGGYSRPISFQDYLDRWPSFSHSRWVIFSQSFFPSSPESLLVFSQKGPHAPCEEKFLLF